MDKTVKYQQIISDLLDEYAGVKKTLRPQVRAYAIKDPDTQQYQLLSLGWQNERRVFTVALHFSIEEGAIWIQENNTDVLIADELIERGVAPEDIVLGFIPQSKRHLVKP